MDACESIAGWKNLLKTVCARISNAKVCTLKKQCAATLSVCVFAWFVDLCQALWPPQTRDTVLNGEASSAESCCHFVWPRREEAPRVWKDSQPPRHRLLSPTRFLIFPPPASSSHSQKLLIAPSEGSGLGGWEKGSVGVKNKGRREEKVKLWGEEVWQEYEKAHVQKLLICSFENSSTQRLKGIPVTFI